MFLLRACHYPFSHIRVSGRNFYDCGCATQPGAGLGGGELRKAALSPEPYHQKATMNRHTNQSIRDSDAQDASQTCNRHDDRRAQSDDHPHSVENRARIIRRTGS
jgi:hypothetical protein